MHRFLLGIDHHDYAEIDEPEDPDVEFEDDCDSDFEGVNEDGECSESFQLPEWAEPNPDYEDREERKEWEQAQKERWN